MITHWILIGFLILIFGLYVGMVYIRYGVLDSISSSYYELEKEKKGFQFTIFILYLSSFMVLFFVELTPEGTTKVPWLFILSAACLGFLSVAPKFKLKLEGWVHNVGATGGIVTALLGLWQAYGTWYWTPIALVAALILKYCWPNHILKPSKKYMAFGQEWILGEVSNFTWWLEISAFIIIILGFIIQ